MDKDSAGLRFAPIILVSEAEKGKKKENLATQTDRFKEYVAILDRKTPAGCWIPDDCWEYCGQEHATPDAERKLTGKLLVDCTKN